MKSAIRKPSIKDLKTALNVLSVLSVEVPDSVFVELSETIRRRESERNTRRLNRMTEDELIRYGQRPRTTLQVILPDGHLIQARRNAQTFVMALAEVGEERLAAFRYMVGRKQLLVFDNTQNKKLYRHYLIVRPGILVYGKITSEVMRNILLALDEQFLLNWEIRLV